MSWSWTCWKWCENHQKGVSGKLHIYCVIKTSRVRQLTDSIKAEPKHSSCCESALISEWSYENEKKEQATVYFACVCLFGKSEPVLRRKGGYMWVRMGGDLCISECKCFESEVSLSTRG